MSREIKFRAWDKQAKLFLDVEAHFSNEVSITPDDESRGHFRPAQFEADQTRIQLLQYTGLKDKNGTEIYEGDLIDEPGAWGARTVVWRWAGWALEEDGEFYAIQVLDEMEVIGNIYENPELLK